MILILHHVHILALVFHAPLIKSLYDIHGCHGKSINMCSSRCNTCDACKKHSINFVCNGQEYCSKYGHVHIIMSYKITCKIYTTKISLWHQIPFKCYYSTWKQSKDALCATWSAMMPKQSRMHWHQCSIFINMKL